MANEQNLKGHGFHERSASEARESGRKGGIQSGKARREKKLFRELFNEMLDETQTDDSGQIITTREVIVRKAVKFLTDEKEDDSKLEARDYIKVMEFIRDTVGEKPTDKVELSVDDESAREIDEYFAGKNNRTTGK